MEKVINISPSSKDFNLAIAIDFGTTRSGFVYCFLDHGADEISTSTIHTFDDWSWAHNSPEIDSYAKTQTELLYSNKKLLDWAWNARNRSLTDDNSQLLTRFKLKLPEDSETFIENGTIYNIIEVVSDYLTFMKKTIFDVINGELSLKITEKDVLWCLTIPAIWNDLAADRMRKAAVRAKLIKEEDIDLQLLLVREPEAAAVHCYFNSLNKNLQIDETFIVIDAGGGTIDLTSYKVLGNKKLQEIAKSSGGNNGSSFVDQNFIFYLQSIGLDTISLAKNDRHILFYLLEAWVSLKHVIKSENMDYLLKIPNWKYFKDNQSEFLKRLSNTQNGNDELIILSSSVIYELFNPNPNNKTYYSVFAGIKNDIEEHIKSLNDKGFSKVDYIFLVGGFNRSPLLTNFILQNFKYIVDNNTERFIKPLRPEQAIMEGACIYGINPNIIHSRISKLTYGLGSLERYDPNLHKGRPYKKFDDGIEYCTDKKQFLIMCQKNESIDFDECVSRIYVPVEKSQTIMPIEIFCSDSETPIYVNDKGVKKLGEIEVALPGYGLERKVVVRFYFGKGDIKIELENLQTNEIRKTSVKFFTSFG